jgi:hypothetical protein
MEYDVANPAVWMQGIAIFFDDPGVILGEAFGERAEAPLFQFISMMSIGIVLLGIAAVWWAIAALLPGLMKRSRGKPSTSSLRIPQKSKKDTPAPSKDASVGFDDEEFDKAAPPSASTASRIRKKLIERSKADNFDSEIDASTKPGMLAGMGGVLKALTKKKEHQDVQERPENAAARSIYEESASLPPTASQRPEQTSGQMVLTQKGSRKKTARLKFQDKASGGVASRIASVFSPLLSRFGSKASEVGGSENSGADTLSSARRIAEQSTFHGTIMEWFAAVQSNSLPQHELVQRAAQFAAMLGPKERDAFTEEYSIDGAFVLRLIDSWSTRTDVGLGGEESGNEESRNDDRQALRAAIRAVHMEKAGLSAIDEKAIPNEFNTSLDVEAPEASAQHTDDEGIDDDVMYAGSQPTPVADNEAKMRASVEQIAQEMRVFTQTIKRCLLGEIEWPEDLSYEEDREDEIDRLDKGWGVISFTMSSEDVERIASEEGSENLDWLVQETTVLETGFKEFIQNLMSKLSSEGEVEPSDGGTTSWEDADVADTQPGLDPIVLDEEDGPSTSVEPTETSTDEEVESALVTDDLASQTPVVDPVPSTLVPDEEASTSDEETQQQEEPLAQVEGQAQGMEDEDASADANVLPQEQADVPPPSAPVHVAQSVGLDDETEVALADDAVVKWGAILQECGATGGAIMKFVYEKNGAAVKPQGVIHVAALWKGRAGIGRVNVMFRTLPDGEWSADPSVPGRFTNEKGDWVAVRETLFGSVDFGNALLIVHLRGDGVFNTDRPLPEAWGKALWVVRDVPRKDDITERMDAAV